MKKSKLYLEENVARACMPLRKEMEKLNRLKAIGGYPLTIHARHLSLVGVYLPCEHCEYADAITKCMDKNNYISIAAVRPPSPIEYE